MKKVSHKAPKVKAIHKDDATPQTPLEEELGALDTRIALIQALIPLGLDAVGRRIARRSDPLGRSQIHTQRHPKPQSSVGQSTRVCVSLRSESAHTCSQDT